MPNQNTSSECVHWFVVFAVGTEIQIMTSQRPKSPHAGAKKEENPNESFWDKIGTLGRKKKVKEGMIDIDTH